MHVLAEHIACVVSENEFEEAAKTYSDIYIVTTVGTILRHTKLKGGRSVRIEVKEIPGLKPEEVKAEVQEEINFLPNGKIPAIFLDELVQFFKEVMTIKKADQEAMAHVLWNEKDKENDNRGYRISIPNQVVGKASVRYENDHIHTGDIVVLDIHSHNTMGAFFSSTDDTDDRKGINYAGVVGKLDNSNPEFKWRFNFNDVKREAQVHEIFDLPKREVKIPSEWLDRVKTHYQSGPPYGGTHGGKSYPPAGGGWDGRRGRTTERTDAGGRRTGNSVIATPDWVRFPPGYEDIQADLYDEEYLSALAYNEAGQQQQVKQRQPGDDDDKEGPSRRSLVVVDYRNMSPKDVNTLGKRGVDIEVVDSLPLGGGSGQMSNVEEYGYNACEYGKDAADAFDQIDCWLTSLEGVDELLLQVIVASYGLLTSQGQAKLDRQGIS